MALVVRPTSPALVSVNPTAALQAALTGFENALTAEQLQQFQAQTSHFNQQRPDASSVIQFVAQIDALNHQKTRNSVSNRLCTFLDALQQFTGVVDTFVSSNPAIAALLWGGIKTSFLIASNFTSYFDKVASMIMNVGKICPIFREFSHLYIGSTAVQQALCEYYAAVVKLATKIIQVSQRTVFDSFLSAVVSPFESEFRPLQENLAEASRIVQLQVSVAAKQTAQASARLAELERRENRQHRRLARRLASETRAEYDAAQQVRLQESARRAAKMRLYIRDQLSTINQQTPWKQAQKQRLAKTAEWFRNVQDFQAWEADLQSATLWSSGRMGAGKTILMSSIIAYLHLSISAGGVVSFHFCHAETSASLLARNILGTLARQLLDAYITNAQGDELQALHDACQDMDTGDIVGLLKRHLHKDKTYFIIIDGLDECAPDQIVELVASLLEFHRAFDYGIKICYSARPELEQQLFRGNKPKYRLPLSKAMLNADIEYYIDTELDECLQRQRIKLVNPETILKIRNTLSTEHDGL